MRVVSIIHPWQACLLLLMTPHLHTRQSKAGVVTIHSIIHCFGPPNRANQFIDGQNYTRLTAKGWSPIHTAGWWSLKECISSDTQNSIYRRHAVEKRAQTVSGGSSYGGLANTWTILRRFMMPGRAGVSNLQGPHYSAFSSRWISFPLIFLRKGTIMQVLVNLCDFIQQI